ncbi:MAG: response regulator [Thermodesulfobacteriota bacterium]
MMPNAKPRILIVDDVPENVKILIHALQPDYRLSVATNGEDAMRIAGSDDPPDLILLDVMMPEMDGYEVCRRLRRDEKSSGIPIIFLTAKADELDETQGLELGAADYITKPFRLPIVKARVRNQLAHRQGEEIQRQVERMGAVADLASGVAHHFNNMLQVIMGGASVALLKLDQGDLGGTRTMLEQIIESSRFGSQTVRRLQEFVRKPAGEAPTEGCLDLSSTAAQAIETTRTLWEADTEKSGIHIELIPKLAAGCRVRGRESELFEMITLLIRNAVEAMPRGGELRIETSVGGGEVVLQVGDTGAGISVDHLGKIFEPFFTTKGLQRVGMGLATSYGIVKNHGGTIAAESAPGQGAVFTVRMPLVKDESSETGSPVVGRSSAGLRILVIDDVPPITNMLVELLSEFGHTVIGSLSGEQGLQIFNGQPIDLVICDLGMPGMSGWDVGRTIKESCAHAGRPKVPFVLLSGWGGQLEKKERILESGVDAVMEKPLDAAGLEAVIHNVMG